MILEYNPFEKIPERLDASRNFVPEDKKDCVWGDAGAVPYKFCNSHFDCSNCSFDFVMQGGNKLTSGSVDSDDGKLCTHRFYHHCHFWAQVEENALVRIGIDDFGQNILGPIEKITLPLRNEKIDKKSILIKARGSIIPLIPFVDGYVEEVNDDLIYHPQLANKSPYEMGWFVLLRPIRLVQNLRKLFYGASAIKWFDVERFRLAALITSELNNRMVGKSGMTLPNGSLPDFDMLNELPPSITKKVLEQCFLYCHTNDKFKDQPNPRKNVFKIPGC